MSPRVIRFYSSATFGIDAQGDAIAHCKHTLLNLYFVKIVPGSHRVGIFDLAEYIVAFDRSGVANLTAGLGVEGGSIKNDLADVGTLELGFLYFTYDDRQYLCAVSLSFAIAGELGRLQISDHARVDLAHS